MITLRTSLVLVFAAVAAFGLCLAAPFHFDDYAIFSDPVLTSPSGWWEVWQPFRTRPLTDFTFWVNYRWWGRDPAGYHAVNLALHVAAVLLLWTALRRILPRAAAFLGALVFALHPIQTEAVVYVFARGTLLATALCLLLLALWLRGRHWIAALCFAFALLAKEECVALPLFYLLLHFSVSYNRRELRPIVVMLGLSLAAGLRAVAATALRPGAGAGFQAGVSPLQYLSAQGVAMLRYFRLLLMPWGFSVDPDLARPPLWAAILAWLAILALVVLAWRRFDKAREGFWFVGGLLLLLPSSSIFPAADLAADRRMYLPMAAFAAAAGLLLRNVRARYVVPVALALGVLSYGRTEVWRTEESLWRDALRKAPAKIRPKLQLARVAPAAEAFEILTNAKRLAPDDPSVASALGRHYLVQGDAPRALAEFGRALALKPRDPAALNNRGAALLALGQATAARQDFENALAIDPCLFDARYNLLRLGMAAPRRPICRYTDVQERLLNAGDLLR